MDIRLAWPAAPERTARKWYLFAAAAVVVVLVAVGAAIAIAGSGGWTPAPESSPAAQWNPFTSPDGWTVNFPGASGTPHTMTQTMDAGFGQTSITMYLSQDGGAVYEAASMTVPLSERANSVDSLLKGAEKGVTLMGKVEGERTFTLNGNKVLEFKFSMTTMGLEGTARFWVQGDNFYMLIAMAAPGTPIYPEHFFDTFKAP